MSPIAGNMIWQYWETRGNKPKFIDGLHGIARKNSGVQVILVTPETLRSYLPDLDQEVHQIVDLSHKADMIRTRLVMNYGGMWLDSDAVVLSDLNWLFKYLEDHEFVGFNNVGLLQAERPWVKVSCFVSRPNGKVIGEWVRLQRAKFPRTTFGWTEIGADLLNAVCLENKPRVKILPFEGICPIPWDTVEAFSCEDDAGAERILETCPMVMLSNRSLQTKNPQLQQLTVEEIAAGDYVLARILRRAIASSIPDGRPLGSLS